ncbi:hypothetical protein B0T26DRAFT_798426 [Lasiosphaeria miniovina]|uniref:Uncharacterized protein n=1 Tax=Lasiosphaeria miniovina TaxID=1954250 RepID=A0AA40EC76_9PEZI|nr:uncharacterized protein B0T26DRAFT_798426 [Lasiosphaeria miniovina]KAK0734630.1 hypothetical protein B0T26DRAFT_798426 [Lasiosphaeria miniovina]
MAETLFWLRLSELSRSPDLDTTPPPRDGFVVSDGSDTSKWTPSAFDSALSSLACKLRESRLPHVDYDADGAEDVVDLSVLTEEHPAPADRPDGQGIDDKTAMRHFLHELRRGGGIFGGDPNIKRMNELFNSRGCTSQFKRVIDSAERSHRAESFSPRDLLVFVRVEMGSGDWSIG